jgi:hypothetical protein
VRSQRAGSLVVQKPFMRVNDKIITLAALLLLMSCAPALAWVGAVNHDWTLRIPQTETRLGIVEWQTGGSTVFLGVLDFALPFGAFSLIAMSGICLFGLAAAVMFRRGHK